MSTTKKRKLRAILFADIVGYTSLMQKDEAHASVLLQKFRNTLNEKVTQHSGEVINNYGDGCLCTFESAVDAMTCAKGVQLFFQKEPIVPVRIGLHSGDVFFEDDNVFGDSVNIASRIESLGVAGAVLFSKQINRHISNQTAFEVQSLGEFDFKNVEKTMEVFALANEGFVIPKREEMKGRLKKTVSKKKKWLVPLIAISLLFFAGVFWKINFSTGSKLTDPNALIGSVSNNSLAVLPFTNMSANEENQYFCEGMHDDLLTHLSKIGSMKVISRTSVLRFKNTEQPIPEIAKELSVANILEGSVRRSGNQIRINVQLIKAETDEHLWSEIYDRELSPNNIFDIQSEIAKQIAASLKTNITREQKVALEERPTENLEAYEAYLRGRQLVEGRVTSEIQDAKKYLEKAIKLDSEFAQAYVKLGEVHYLLVEYAYEDSKTNYALAWDYCSKAKSINENLAEIYALECTLFHYDKGDIEDARRAYEKAIELNPNYADAYFWYSHAILEIERDSKKALGIIEKAVQLNPLSPKFLNMMGAISSAGGLKEKARQALHKAIDLSSNYEVPYRNLSFLYAGLGQLDSSTIITHESFNKHPNDTEFLGLYLRALNELDMKSELDFQMDQFSLDNRFDSLFYFISKTYSALWGSDFDNAQIYFEEMMKLNNDIQGYDPTLEMDIYFYKKDFQKAANIFERNYPDVLATDYFENYMFSGYSNLLGLQDGLQNYIYCLTQIGKKEKALQLLDKYKERITANINKEGDLDFEVQARDYFKVRNLIIEGKHDLAVEQFSKLFDGKVRFGWKYLLTDPIFDEIRDDPKYLQIESAIKIEVARQREIVRAYLKIKD